MSTSSDYAGALSCTARLAVPTLADWCFVDVIGREDGDEANIHRLVVGYAESTEEAKMLARELELHYPLKPDASHGTPKVLRTGQSEIIREVTDEVLETIARDAEHLAMLQKLEPHSYMCVPLRVRRRLIGALGLVSTECGRHYREEELSMAEGLAYCSALTIDHMLQQPSQTNTVQELVQLFGESQATVVSASQERSPKLTPRQLEVLELISHGRSATEIKIELRITEATVRGHIRSVLRAFEAHSQLEAVSRARRLGLLSS